jgi:hypothetical protein
MNTTDSAAPQVGAQDIAPRRPPKPLSAADVDRAVTEAFAAVFRRRMKKPVAWMPVPSKPEDV